MKNELKVFNEQMVLGREFKIYGDVEQPLFLAKDVANWIEYDDSKVGQMIKNIDEDEYKTSPIYYSGQVREMYFLTEDGLYEVLMQSRKPIAKEFKKEVKKILKQIRLTGGVVTEDREEEFISNYFPSFSEEVKVAMVQDLRVQNKKLKETIEQKNQQLLEYEPKVTYYDEVLTSTDAVNISVIAKDYGMSAKEFNKILHKYGVQYKLGDTWLLYQNYADKGYTKSKTTSYKDNDGNIHTKLHTKWNQKGRLFIYDTLKKNDILPIIEK